MKGGPVILQQSERAGISHVHFNSAGVDYFARYSTIILLDFVTRRVYHQIHIPYNYELLSSSGVALISNSVTGVYSIKGGGPFEGTYWNILHSRLGIGR